MLKSTFTAFYRSFVRHPLYALLNLLGLSFGIAVFIALSLYVRFETSFENWVPQHQKIYAVGTQFFFPGVPNDIIPYSMGGIIEELKGDYPQTEAIRDWSNPITVHKGANVFAEQVELVDGNFINFFGLDLVAGDPQTALSAPSNILLSEDMAQKYFRSSKIVGQKLSITDADGRHDYLISGVMKTLPKNTDAKFNFVRLLTPQRMAKEENWHHWGSIQLSSYLKFDTPQQAQIYGKQMEAFTDRHVGKSFGDVGVPHKVMRIHILPLGSLHLLDPKSKTAVVTLGVVGLVAFALAAINYINLATARAGMRAREVAVRKTLGATIGALRGQFMCEAILTILLAFLMGLALVELSLPFINTIGGLYLKLDYVTEGAWLLGILGAVIVAGLIAGIYPAVVLSGFKPAQVLASSRTPSGGRMGIRIREGLVIVQFSMVIVAFILVLGFLQQLNHMKTSDIGFRREGVLLLPSTHDVALTESQRQALWTLFRAIPQVQSVTASDSAPGDDSNTNNIDFAPEDYKRGGGPAPTLSLTTTGPDYFKTYGARLLAGRFLDEAHSDQRYEPPADTAAAKAEASGISNVVITRLGAKRMGFDTPQKAINQVLISGESTKARVVGVIEDMRFRTPKTEMARMIYFFNARPSYTPITAIRYAGMSQPDIRKKVASIWRNVAPDVPIEMISAEDNLDKYYKPDRNRSNLFSIGAGIAALIGCIGLYGMAAFNTSRRAREVGLRKVLGASSGQVTRLLVGQFLRPVVIANLMAWPLAYFGLKSWLSQFDAPVAINPLSFVCASAVALLIALLTVGGLAMISAGSEPGKALRHE